MPQPQRTPAQRNLEAEVRAVEEGHHALLLRDQRGAYLRVVSDTVPGKEFRVRAYAPQPGDQLMFECEPHGVEAGVNDHKFRSAPAGIAGCKHAALAARRLERAGIATFANGRWYATQTVGYERIEAGPADPFAGL